MSAALVRAAYEAYGPALHCYLMRRLSDSQIARDIEQEAFLRLHRVAHTELIHSPQAYLFRIASNLVWEFEQQERREVVQFDSRMVECAAEGVSDSLAIDPGERIDIECQLETVLAQLPPHYAAILVMKKRDGKSLKEIALELNLSIHAVKKYLCRAVAHCRTKIVYLLEPNGVSDSLTRPETTVAIKNG
jgi:RNA polymerase sigma factor (sigma-70 family)